MLKDGSLVIEEIDAKTKKFLNREDTMNKVMDLRNLADEIVDNAHGTFRLKILAETPEYDDDGYRYFPDYNVYHPLIYSGVEVDKIEFTDENKKKVAEDKNKEKDIFICSFGIYPDEKISVTKFPYYEDYGIVTNMQEFIEYKERIKEFILKNFKNTSKYRAERF